MEVNPLNIFFVKSDSKGDRLLFRYPYTLENKDERKQEKCGRHNPYAINITEDLLQNPQSQTSNICKGQLSGFTDEMLSTLFAVKAELCNRKFELKVNDVRFVGHPTLLPYRTNKDDTAAMILINIVFALQASASHSIVKCYYDLSKRLGKALRHEEKRCSYLTEEMKIMLAAHDELSTLDGEVNSGENDEENSRHSVSSTTYSTDNWIDDSPKNAFHLILQRSTLARSMKAVDPNDLLASIPLDSSQALLRLIKAYSPLKSLQTLAIEADISLTQMLSEFSLPAPLWYVCRSGVSTGEWGPRGGVRGGAGGSGAGRLARRVAWLLRRRLLLQLHTYVQFNSPHWPRQRSHGHPEHDGPEYFCEKHDSYYQSSNVSYSSLNHLQLNVPEPVEARDNVNSFPDSDEDYPTQNNLNQTDFSHTKPIVIESENTKFDDFQVDSANHSFEGVDVIDGLIKTHVTDFDKEKQTNSIDSGISPKVNGNIENDDNKTKLFNTSTYNNYETPNKQSVSFDSGISNTNRVLRNVHNETNGVNPEKTMTSRLSDGSLRDYSENRDTSSDEDVSPRQKYNGYGCDRRHGVSLNLKLQRYFRGEQHLEEIMFMENVTRSQLMQLLDKFKDVLITFETEDPAVAMLYPYQ
ncbi:unnamed protein product [Leptidea sinapis]|uniref:GATOR1 complex protein NPRL3 C-terminal HTH domain-containing protein n=1 Tax=Leptidea sinapis TaxID=189913 RepID=A0A5E4QCC5_9NEOP|nr:unnamed protein product [Leptidea sinapis]